LKFKTVRGLLDSGSVATIVSEQFVSRHGLNTVTSSQDSDIRLISASGKPLDIVGSTDFTVNIGGLLVPIYAKVARYVTHDLILGTDFLRENGVIIDYNLGVVSLNEDLVRTPLQTEFKQRNLATNVEAVCLPAESEALIKVRCPRYFDGKTVILEPIPSLQFHICATARSLGTCQDAKTVCRVFNPNPFTVVLRKGMRLASVHSTDVIASCAIYKPVEQPTKGSRRILNKQDDSVLETFAEDYGFVINKDLSATQRRELLQLLFDYKGSFARSLAEMKVYKGYEHDIELLSNRRIFKRNYRLTPEDAAEAERQIQEMVQLGIVEETTDANFNSPIFLVDKKNGEKRLIVDLRNLNSIIRPMLVQLPKVNELIDDVTSRKCNYLTSCDLKAGFWQISIREGSRPCTTFTAPQSGLRYNFARLPFGLSQSPASLTKILVKVFAGKLGKNIFLYMDDILLVNESWEGHLATIEETLHTLETNNLSCNPSKCSFAMSKVEFLGFEISREGIKIGRRKLAAIHKLAAPKNRKSLQRLFGLVNFWRHFIPQFAQKTYNMRLLLSKDAPFMWNENCDQELQYLKNCLTSDPILQPLDTSRGLIIMADASGKTGLGYQILQVGDDNKLHAVSYGSQALTKSQRNWTVSQLELAAIVSGLRAYECFAIRTEVTVITDNSHCLALDKWLPVNARERRMIAYLMQFRLKVRYLEGCKNAPADALSRSLDDMSPETRLKFAPELNLKDDFIISLDSPGAAQKQDELQTEERERRGEAVRVSYMLNSSEPATNQLLEDSASLDDGASDSVGIFLFQQAVTAVNEATDPTNNANLKDDDKPEVVFDYFPTITANDYIQDEEFKNIYAYLTDGDFTGDDKDFKEVLLVADQYFIRNDCLYKIGVPRNVKVSRVHPVVERLCVPKVHRHMLLRYYHDNFGHAAVERLFLSMYSVIYWKSMYPDIRDFCKTCDTCHKSKRNFAHRTRPLNPLPVANGPFKVWNIDHKDLCRKTNNGSVAILCCIDAFSGWPVLAPVKTMDAETTAKVFFKEVISKFGIPEMVISDRGASFCSKFFSTLMTLLKVKHRISAARAPRSNGLAESLVKRLSDLIKIYVKTDSEIEDYLPLIEMILRSTTHSNLKISPHEVYFGSRMNLGDDFILDNSNKLTTDQYSYLEWLSLRLKDIHKAVSENLIENKQEMKDDYDKRHNVKLPTFKIGDKVLLEDKRVRPGSDQVLTQRPYCGPYFIADTIAGDGIGEAYKLIHVQSGRSIKSLVSGDRLKHYEVDNREKLTERLPGVLAPPSEVKPVNDRNDGYEPAIRITRQRVKDKQREYLVLFRDGSSWWCSDVTPTLLQQFRLKQAQKRRRRK